MFARWAAVVLIPALLGPATSGVSGPADHECTGHSCHCPPRRSAAQACHGEGADKPVCEMRGACRHDTPALVMLPSYELRASEGLVVDVSWQRLLAPRAVEIAPGFHRIEPHPPRSV